MKISYSNYPILKKLKDISLGKIPVIAEDKPFFDMNNEAFRDTSKRYNKYFTREINVISKAFDEAATQAAEKLSSVVEEICQNDALPFSIDGTFIYGDFVKMIHLQTIQGSQEMEV